MASANSCAVGICTQSPSHPLAFLSSCHQQRSSSTPSTQRHSSSSMPAATATQQQHSNSSIATACQHSSRIAAATPTHQQHANTVAAAAAPPPAPPPSAHSFEVQWQIEFIVVLPHTTQLRGLNPKHTHSRALTYSAYTEQGTNVLCIHTRSSSTHTQPVSCTCTIMPHSGLKVSAPAQSQCQSSSSLHLHRPVIRPASKMKLENCLARAVNLYDGGWASEEN